MANYPATVRYESSSNLYYVKFHDFDLLQVAFNSMNELTDHVKTYLHHIMSEHVKNTGVDAIPEPSEFVGQVEFDDSFMSWNIMVKGPSDEQAAKIIEAAKTQ